MKLVRKILAGASVGAMLSLSAPAMSAQEAMIGEVREFGFNYCPRGWAKAEGQKLSVSENQALFSLLGTAYGGDGRKTFALPDLRVKSSSPAQQNTGGEARFYQHCAFTGWEVPMGLGEYRADDLPAALRDNDMSSLRLSPGWKVTLYDGPNLDGASVTLTGEESCLIGRDFNDRASSMKIERVTLPPEEGSGADSRDGAKLTRCIALQGIYPARN